jgi:predicted Zn-dependent peptidase
MIHHLDTLANGLRVLRIPMPGVQSVTVLALVNTGRRYEPENLAGISHFLEHMVFKGTAHYADAQALSAAIDKVGGEFNAFTSKEYTGYYVKLAARYLDTALDVVTDMLCAPALRQSDIDNEVKVIAEEINMYEDMPMRNVQDKFDELMFAGQNLSGNILGTKQTIFNIKSDDFQNYIKQWYGFKNVVLVIAGHTETVEAPTLLDAIGKAVEKGGGDRQSSEQPPFWHKAYGGDHKLIVFKETEQAHFVIGLPGFERTNPQRYAANVLSTLLGKTMSSRLFTEIREKRGLCYYVRTQLDFFHDVGVFGAAAGVDPRRIEEAIAATRSEFLALNQEKPVTAQEVQDAKQNLIGGLALELEDSQNVAAWFGMKELLEGVIETEEETIQHIEAVTLEQVQSVAQQLIKPEEMRLTLIGPFRPEQITIM